MHEGKCEITDKHIWFDSYLQYLPELGDAGAQAKADEILAVVNERFPAAGEPENEEAPEVENEMPVGSDKLTMADMED